MDRPFDLPVLRARLAPWRVHYRPRLRSTSDHAATLRREGRLLAPALVLTARQTAGRGREGRTWHSPPGALAVTFVLPADEGRQPFQLALLAGLAVSRACRRLAPAAVLGLKWPNDVQLSGRKLAGVLCERLDGLDLVGVGLNAAVETAVLPAGAASLREVAQVMPQEALMEIHGALVATLADAAEGRWAHCIAEWNRQDALAGRRVAVVQGQRRLEGRVHGLDPAGRLVLQTPAGREVVATGTILPFSGQ